MSKGKPIDNFRKGDIVSRVEPVYQGVIDNLKKDSSYMGVPLKIVSFWMNYVCFKDIKGKEVVLENHLWNDGWDNYFPEVSAVKDLNEEFKKRNLIN